MPGAPPELKKIESDNPRTSADEASAQDSNNNVGATSIIMEIKKEESSNPENSLIIGNSSSQGETCNNPTVTVLEAEKVGSSEPSEPTMPVSTAITDGDPTVSKMEESSNVNVSAEHTKE